MEKSSEIKTEERPNRCLGVGCEKQLPKGIHFCPRCSNTRDKSYVPRTISTNAIRRVDDNRDNNNY